MSITPTDAYRSSPSSSRALPRNPRSSHDLREAFEPQIEAAGAGAGAGASTPPSVPSPERLSEDPVGIPPGSTIGVSGSSCDTTKKVIEHGISASRKDSQGQNSGILSPCQSTGRREILSQLRSDQFGPQSNGRPCGTDPASGSSGIHVNDGQSASRRNQVVNANHLLNFHYDPIFRPQPRIQPPRRQQKIKPYNRDLFLQANYKFVVLDTGNYQLESMDPDKMLPWEDVVCVRYSTPIPVQCPICLENPLCPQITSCGHIYCFPCILQYLLMGVGNHMGECWKKCPLCFMMISSKDLYTIHINNVQQFHVGDHAYFTLLTRPKNSLVPSLKHQHREVDPMPCGSDGLFDLFCKFILTSDVELSVREAKSDLESWICKAESDPVYDSEKVPYVSAALERLEERRNNWMERQVSSGSPPLRNAAFSSCNSKIANTLKTQTSALNVTSNAERASDAWEPADGALCTSLKHERVEFSENVGAVSSPFTHDAVPESYESSERLISANDEVKVLPKNANVIKDDGDRDSYTFYQAIDGQHLILHPLNMKCLLQHYRSYGMLPQRISGEILELETVTQSEAMRRRYRFLSHFCLTTTFQLCEIDLTEILPPSSLAPLMGEIKKRDKARKRLARKEDDERARAEAAAVLDRPMPPNGTHSSNNNPIFSLDDFTALGGCSAPSTSPPAPSGRKLFSNVARLGFAAAHDSPALKAEKSAVPSGDIEKTAEASSNQGPRATTTLSFANIIASAAKTEEKPESQQKITNVSAKKGKKPAKVLLSTSGGRRY